MSTMSRIALALTLIALTAGSGSLAGCATVADKADSPAASSTGAPTPAPTPTLTEGELLAWKQMAANNPDALGPGEGEAEYAQARSEFPLAMPEGTAIPETTSFSFYAPGGILGRGAGYGLVSFTWLCATETELLDAIDADDPDRADASFVQLELWMALPSKQRVLEGIDAFRSVVVEPARAGDTKPLEADRQSWCAQAPFEAT
jgi:hypothetical protein